MKTRIRLTRVGAKNKPKYRIVVAASAAPRDGNFLEVLGHYDPAKGIEQAVYDGDKVKLWIGRGALPSETVQQILKRGQQKAQGVVGVRGA